MGIAELALFAHLRSCFFVAVAWRYPQPNSGGHRSFTYGFQSQPFDCFDVFTSRFFTCKVGQLIGRAGLSEADREDLIQEFVLRTC